MNQHRPEEGTGPARHRADGAPALARGPLRIVLLGLGWLFVGLGVLGAVIPVLPTTPFILLAAACFARSSERFYGWLMENRIFGPLIQDWREHGAIPRRARWLAISAIVLFLGSSVVFFVVATWLRVVLLAIGIGLVTYLYRLPSREDVVPDEAAPVP